MFVAQILNLLYNIVDRIYIARIPRIGTAALGAVGLCFPIVILITAFTNMFGSGGAPLFSISRGAGNRKEASMIQNTAFFMLLVTAGVLTVLGEFIGSPLLRVFGASDQAMVHALPYLRIYLLGTIFSMIATGMNPFINAQGYSTIGMTTVMIGAVANIILDPVMIFVLGLGVEGAAIATILSQALSAAFVLRFLLGKKVDYRLRLLRADEIRSCGPRARRIIGLGMAAFIMQLTNSLVIISFNYGAGRYKDVKKAGTIMFLLSLFYAGGVWILIRLFPAFVIGIFSSDAGLMETALPSFNLYFSTFIFMVFQHCGQIVFKSLGKKNHAIFFSLFRKGLIVVPLTYLLPYAFHMGTAGVFAAEPVSNVLGGMACFITMLLVVLPELNGRKKT